MKRFTLIFLIIALFGCSNNHHDSKVGLQLENRQQTSLFNENKQRKNYSINKKKSPYMINTSNNQILIEKIYVKKQLCQWEKKFNNAECCLN